MARQPIALTMREIRVLKAIVAGLKDKQIACHIGGSPQTVKSHVKTILRKLRVHSRTSAAVWYVRSQPCPNCGGKPT